MKILLVNDYGTATGGAELQMLSLKQGLIDRGHNVRLFSSHCQGVENLESSLLADYHCFGSNSRLQVLSQTVNPSSFFALKKVLREFQPDVVHVRMFLWQLSPLILPLLKSFPSLYQTAVYKAICPVGTKILPDKSPCYHKAGKVCLSEGCVTPQSWLFLMVQRQLWLHWRSAFDTVVALSHRMKTRLEAEGVSPVQVVYNGVAFREMRPPLENLPIVAFAGRLSSEKGVDVLMKAFAKIVPISPEAQLLIAGEGKEKGNLRQLAEALKISQNVKFLGYLTRSELENAFNCAWVQVVPSIWDEPFGNVTTEAMMRGTAVIASAVGAQPEIIEEGVTGLLVPPNDEEALSTALLSILKERDLAEKMGQFGRKRAIERFSEDHRTEHFLEIYQQILTKYSYE
jgi:glycosyltransferase involved in cell wall biosynthesis